MARTEPQWRALLERECGAVFELRQQIMEGSAVVRDLPVEFLRAVYRKPLDRTRLPVFSAAEPPDAEANSAAKRTDYGTITILWQDAVGSLPVRNTSGDCFDALPTDDTFIIDISDMPRRCSNDVLVSTPESRGQWGQ